MRVLLAGATGAIGRPLIRGLKQHGHSVFGLVRSAESTRMLTEMGAEAVIGDALDAAISNGFNTLTFLSSANRKASILWISSARI
jgi:uncharacterized protein YbjT (DUF2867 family)